MENNHKLSNYIPKITSSGKVHKPNLDSPFYDAECAIRDYKLIGLLDKRKINIIFFTSSDMKCKEVQEGLGREVYNVVKFPINIEEIQALSPVTVSSHKIRLVSRLYNERYPNGSESKIWLLVEDTGLYKINDLENVPNSGFPHALVKWDMEMNGMKNLEGLVCEHSTFGLYNYNNGFSTIVEGRSTGIISLTDENGKEIVEDQTRNWDYFMTYTNTLKRTCLMTINEKLTHSSRGEAISSLTAPLNANCSVIVFKCISAGRFCDPGELHPDSAIEDFYKLTYGHTRGERIESSLAGRKSDEFHYEFGTGTRKSEQSRKGITLINNSQRSDRESNRNQGHN